MPKYDVYPSPDGHNFLLDVQTDMLDELNTRVVVPLLPEEAAPKPARILNIVVEIDGKSHVMATQFLSAVPATVLSRPKINLSSRADDITRAIDMLFQGF